MEVDVTRELPCDLVDDILVRLPVKSLIRFKCVSSIWRSTIISQGFKERQLIRGQLFEDPNILIVKPWDPLYPSIDASLLTLTFELSTTPVSFKAQPIPLKSNFYKVTHSCDGLVCIYDLENLMCVMNPATRWQRSLPQPTVLQHYHSFGSFVTEFPSLGFGKDKMRGIYKMVWLYKYFNLNHTTCEVYSFTTNTWSHKRIPPYQLLSSERPVYVDGSLYWLIHGNKERDTIMEILSFDLHTESFREMSQTPVAQTLHPLIKMSSLDNRLCVTVKTSRGLDIWSSNPNLTWHKAYTIHSCCGPRWFGVQIWSVAPVAVLGKQKKKKKLVAHDWNREASGFVVFDFQSRSSSSLRFGNGEAPTAYSPSLITI